MKALIMDEERRMLVREMPEPAASEDNIIIKVHSASICGTDMRTFLKGNAKITPPRIMGHECAGEIIHAGSLAQSKGWKVSDRITVAPAVGCGECVPCKKGHTNMCDHLKTIGFQYEGVFAPYAEIPKQAILMNNVIRLDDSISYDDATLIEPAACALNGQSYLHIGEGDTVVIYGSGIIGCIHAELAFIKGASKVIIVEPVEKRGHIAMEKVPGVIWINPFTQNTVEEVRKLTNGHGSAVVIPATSVPSVHTEAQDIGAFAEENGNVKVCIEAMYAPQQTPWTIEGTKDFLKNIYAVAGHPIYTTVDVGHMTGQRKFRKPTEKQVQADFQKALEAGRGSSNLWLVSERAYDIFADCVRKKMPKEEATSLVMREVERYPYQFSTDERDSDLYAWIEELACYSPIMHIQQTDGITASHAPFTKENNAKGIVDGKKILETIAASYEKEEPGMPPKVDKIVLALELFTSNVDHPRDIKARFTETCRYWKQFIPEDGMRLSELLERLS